MVNSLIGIIASSGGGVIVTGGTLYTSGGYNYRVFTSSGTLGVSAGSITADLLVIAGGGGGGGNSGGNYGAGGAAGGVSYLASTNLSIGSYSVTVGAGGAGTSGLGSAGSNTVWNSSITSDGGAGGGGFSLNLGLGQNGGSGSGAGTLGVAGSHAGGTATQGNTGGATGYGNAGGASTVGAGQNAIGGSGGSGGAGTNGVQNTSGGNGGSGLNTWSTWASATSTGVGGYYAGGGAGFLQNGTSIGTSNAGAGLPRANSVGGEAATANTGSGGGGVWHTTAGADVGGNGGSGIVIVRYPV